MESPCRDRLPQELLDVWIWTDFLVVVCVSVCMLTYIFHILNVPLLFQHLSF
jgi:hypothetical protein